MTDHSASAPHRELKAVLLAAGKAAATPNGRPLMLEPLAFLVAPDVVAATAAATTATSKRAAMLRLFIWKPPGVHSVGTDHLPSIRMVS